MPINYIIDVHHVN